ncbi:hypothetical protein SEA_CHEPLI_54 [Microbacterium phage Chepli]|nr:hypothetical protein SEA_CHEPLI_54 [Microbacterium phage Chepli]
MVQFYASSGTIDAGIVPTVSMEEFRITREDWMSATAEELTWLHDVPLYANQEARVSEEMFSGDVRVLIRYSVPCITSMGRAA